MKIIKMINTMSYIIGSISGIIAIYSKYSFENVSLADSLAVTMCIFYLIWAASLIPIDIVNKRKKQRLIKEKRHIKKAA